MPRLNALAGTLLGALAAWLEVPHPFVDYDTSYALLWGSNLAHGRTPDYSVALAPTPHPLAELAGIALAPLGDGAETAAVVIAYLALGALGYLTYRLGAAWFGAPAGLLAAAIVLTRVPVLSFGVRAYVDIPYVALVLAALLAETRRPRAGAPVLALLGLAGLLRPEAWLFAAAYLAWVGRGRARREVLGLAALAAAAPALWLASDWLIAGNALHSLTGTRDTARTLQRRTGLASVPLVAPRRLGEILREPVLVGAAGGGLLALAWLRERATLLALAVAGSLAAFCVLAAAGLPVIGRYLLLPATIMAIFGGAGAFGWMQLRIGDSRRHAWMGFAALAAVLFAAFAPAQVSRVRSLRADIAIQRGIRDDLHAVARSIAPGCGPVAVPNHRPLPLLGLWGARGVLPPPARGYYLDPASGSVERNFMLDAHDASRVVASVPPGFALVARNASWRLFARCG